MAIGVAIGCPLSQCKAGWIPVWDYQVGMAWDVSPRDVSV